MVHFILQSTSIRSPSEDGPQLQAMDSVPEAEDETDTSSKPLVVISVHPKQEALVNSILG